MKKIVIVIIIAVLAGVAGGIIFISSGGIKENSSIAIPEKCQAIQGDICALFDCMVEQCWCDTGSINPIVFQRDSQITTENQAVSFVNEYLATISTDSEAKKAVKINSFFFNVFVYDKSENESVFSVSANGKIIITICGV